MKDKQNGTIMIVVITLFIFILLGGQFFLTPILKNYSSLKDYKYLKLTAISIAESGINKVMADIKNNQPKDNYSEKFAQGQFIVEVKKISNNVWNVFSRAKLKGEKTPKIFVKATLEQNNGKIFIRKWLEGNYYEKQK